MASFQCHCGEVVEFGQAHCCATQARIPNPAAYLYEPPRLSLRDWFAGQALAGSDWAEWADSDKVLLAADCYAIADAMLAARSKQEGSSDE